jgi:hypothetical protein
VTARTDEGHRRAAARIVVLLALLLGAPVAQAAAPAGDDRVTPAVVGLDNLVGDLQPLRLESGAQAFGIDVSGATAAPDDPALDQADRGSSCAGASGSASASVWYTLRGPGRTPIGEAAWVGIDTVGSTFRNGLQVFVVAPRASSAWRASGRTSLPATRRSTSACSPTPSTCCRSRSPGRRPAV